MGGPVLAADRAWPGRLRGAAVAAAVVLAVALGLDACHGTLGMAQVLPWTALAAALFAVLLPLRTTAGDGWLEVRGLLRGRRYANSVVVASDAPLPADALVRRAARAPVPTRWVEGDALVDLVAGAPPEHDPVPPGEPLPS